MGSASTPAMAIGGLRTLHGQAPRREVRRVRAYTICPDDVHSYNLFAWNSGLGSWSACHEQESESETQEDGEPEAIRRASGAVYHRYDFDFRDYAYPSIRRRIWNSVAPSG